MLKGHGRGKTAQGVTNLKRKVPCLHKPFDHLHRVTVAAFDLGFEKGLGGRSTQGVTRFRREVPSAPLNPLLAGLCIERAINIAGQKMLRPHLSSRPQEHVYGKEEELRKGLKKGLRIG